MGVVNSSEYLSDVFDTLADVGSLLRLLGVVGVDEDGGVRFQSKVHHLAAQLGKMGQSPQQLQDLD